MTLKGVGIKKTMEHLISKYLINDLTREEEARLKTWLEEDSLNRKVFENIVSDWKLSADDISTSKFLVLDRIVNNATSAQALTKERSLRPLDYLMRIAAVMVLGIGLYLIWDPTDFSGTDRAELQEIQVEKEAADGQKLTFELPDGSMVKLNSGSMLSYPKAFSDTRRQVTLTGEAFFDVARDESRPFEIKSGEVNVQVLGTSFNVRSYPDTERVEVAVKTGRVSVESPFSASGVVLVPYEMVVYSTENNSFDKKKIEDSQQVFGWMDQTLVFEDQGIKEILKELSRWYDVKFEVKRELSHKRAFTARYKNPTLKAVLESLSYAYDFNYEIDGKKVIIK